MPNKELISDLQLILDFVSQFNCRPLPERQAKELRALDEKINKACIEIGIAGPDFSPEDDDPIKMIGFCHIPCQRFKPISVQKGVVGQHTGTARNEKSGAKRILVVCKRDAWEKAMRDVIARAK